MHSATQDVPEPRAGAVALTRAAEEVTALAQVFGGAGPVGDVRVAEGRGATHLAGGRAKGLAAREPRVGLGPVSPVGDAHDRIRGRAAITCRGVHSGTLEERLVDVHETRQQAEAEEP